MIRSIGAKLNFAADELDFSGPARGPLAWAFGEASSRAIPVGAAGDTAPDGRGLADLFAVKPSSATGTASDPAAAGGPAQATALGNSITGTVQGLYAPNGSSVKPTTSVTLTRIDSNLPIDPNLPTFIVIHGRTENFDPNSVMRNLADKIDAVTGTAQVLIVDWHDGANSSDFFGETYIQPIAQWVAGVLLGAGFTGSNINIVGHSWGAVMAAELATAMGNVNTIVALDPATDAPAGLGGTNYNTNNIDFSAHSSFSWGFYSVDGEYALGIHAGNPQTVKTADEAFAVKNSSHTGVVSLFTNMLGDSSGPVSQYFQLSNLLADATTQSDPSAPWLANQYDENGALSSSGAYEAVIFTTGGGTIPLSPLTYVARMTVIETFGATRLVQLDNTYFLYAGSTTSGPQLKYQGSAVTSGLYPGWSLIAAEQVSGGYQVAWKNAGTGQFGVWNVDSNGNFVSQAIGIVGASDPGLKALENNFHQDLNGDGTIGLPPPVIVESFGATSLALAGNTYFLYGNGTTNGPQLKTQGSAVTTSLYPGWTLIAAEQVSGGYQVVWKNAGTNQFGVWNVDSNGNFVSQAIGIVGASDPGLQALETSFQQDLNGDGRTGLPPPVIVESYGATSLALAGNTYFLYANGTSNGPQLKTQGSPVTTNQYPGWTLIAAEQVSGGYQVAWKNAGTGQFAAWNVDSSGNFVSQALGIVGASDPGLQALENSFHQDLNGDGTTGLPPPAIVESFGATSLALAGNTYFLYANGTSNGPQLKVQGSPVTTGLYPGWTLFAAEQVSGGYQVAWKNAGTGQYSVWNVDTGGNFTSNVTGIVGASDPGLQALENSFHQDLNGDGTTGLPPPVIVESFGATSLALAGNTYFLYTTGTSNGPQLKIQGSPVTTGLYPGWTLFAAEQVSGGYQVAWKNAGTGQYSVWNVDAGGNFVSNLTGVVTGTSTELESREPAFQQDLNGDGTIGVVAQAPLAASGEASLLNAPAAIGAFLFDRNANDAFAFQSHVRNGAFVDPRPAADHDQIDNALHATMSELIAHIADGAGGGGFHGIVAPDQSVKEIFSALNELHQRDFHLA